MVPIHVAPLRERVDDILFLAEIFAQRFVRKHGVAIRGIAPEAQDILVSHNWPGNVRELQNVIERAVILCEPDKFIDPETLNLEVRANKAIAAKFEAIENSGHLNGEQDPFKTLYDVEKMHIIRALELCSQNRTQAAKMLDINIRTLRNKLNEYKAQVESPSAGDDDDEDGES